MARIPSAADVPDTPLGLPSTPRVPGPPPAANLSGLESAAQTIIAADNARMSRRDTVDRARSISAFKDQSDGEWRRVATEADLADERTLTGYIGYVDKALTTLVDGHTGSEDSKAALFARLKTARDEMVDRAGRATLDAQVKKVDTTAHNLIGRRVAAVAQDPSALTTEFAGLDADLADLAPALPGTREDELRKYGRGQIATTAISSLIDRRDFAAAEEMLKTPGVPEMLGPDAIRSLNGRIITDRAATVKEEQAAAIKIRGIEAVVGPLTQGQKLQALGVISKDSTRQTLPEKITELTATMRVVTGKRDWMPTEQHIAKLAGIAGAEDNPFRSRIGLNKTFVENTPAFSAGLLGEKEEREYLAAVNEYTQIQRFQDPDTGLWTETAPRLPPFVAEALRRRGLAVPEPGGPQPKDGQPTPEPTTPGQRERTIWQRSGNVTGPVSGAAELAGRTPILGEFVPSPMITADRQYVLNARRDLVRVLQNNPRYAEGERKAIEDETLIEPAFFDRPGALRNRLVGIDEAIEKRINAAMKTANSKQVGREERIHAMNVLNGLMLFRENLGVPPKMSPEEFEKAKADGRLRKGDQFIGDDNKVYTVQ